MCTIGNVFESNGLSNMVFKQCDLKDKVNFLKPQVEQGINEIQYLPFLREGSNGPWCGVNNLGVSFVAADSYLDQDNVLRETNSDIFKKYKEIISMHTNAQSAASMMCEFYKNVMKEADIILIADAKETYFIEAYGGEVQMIKRTRSKSSSGNIFASTNHFRMIYGAVPYNKNHSSYLRLQRAESILQCQPNRNGILDTLRDRYFGDTVWSVCRTNNNPPNEELYFTQASAIFYLGGPGIVRCEYIINGNPSTSTWKILDNVFK